MDYLLAETKVVYLVLRWVASKDAKKVVQTVVKWDSHSVEDWVELMVVQRVVD